MSEGGLDREDEEVLRLLRAAMREGDQKDVDEDALAAYVLGTASAEQRASIQSALAGSRELRSRVLELMDVRRPSTLEEQRTFEESSPPPLGRLGQDRLQGPPGWKRIASPTGRLEARSGQRWSGWLFGWATAATAVASVLAVALVNDREHRAMTEPGAISGVVTPRPTPAEGQDAGVVVREILALTDQDRSPSGGNLPVTNVSPDSPTIWLQATLPDVPPDSRVRMTLADSTGQVLLEEYRPAEQFYMDKVIELRLPHVLPGMYELALVGNRNGIAKRVTYHFRVKVAGS